MSNVDPQVAASRVGSSSLTNIHRLPPLVRLRGAVGEAKLDQGLALLTGSQNLLLMAGVTESLAGRAAILRLLPLSQRESRGEPEKPLPW
jgi:hypothetical protein